LEKKRKNKEENPAVKLTAKLIKWANILAFIGLGIFPFEFVIARAGPQNYISPGTIFYLTVTIELVAVFLFIKAMLRPHQPELTDYIGLLLAVAIIGFVGFAIIFG